LKKTAIAVLLFMALLAQQSPAQVKWTEHNLSDVEVWDLNGIVFNNNLFVLVGYSSYQNFAAIVTSTNGSSWTPRTIPSSTLRLQGVTFGNSMYVAVGSTFSAGAAILTSTDGTSWTNRASGTQSTLFGVAWSGTTFAAVGDGGTIMSSTNGTSWTSQTSPTTNTLRGVIWANNGFIAVGDNGTILTSANGTSWTKQTTNITAGLKSVAWGASAGQYCAVGDNTSGGMGMVITSPNATTWTPQSSSSASTLSGVTYGNGAFVAVGDAFNNQFYLYHASIIHSQNGIAWFNDSSKTISGLYSITSGGTQFVAGGLNSIVVTSPFATIGVKDPAHTAFTSHNALSMEQHNDCFSFPAGSVTSMIMHDMRGQRVFGCRLAPQAAALTLPKTLAPGRYLASFSDGHGVTLDRQVIVTGRP
jgi:hypothetical protein